jgi:F420-dependent oxidoreductase-like protein
MIGVYVPGGSAQAIIDNIKQAEAKGIPAFWLTSGGVAADSIMIFAAAAVQTSRIKFGTSITQTWPRHPVAIATQCIAMDQIAPGRFRIGLGASHQPAVEGMYGVEYRKPLTNLREYLFTVQSILKQGEVDFDGTFVKTKTFLGAGPGGNKIEAPVNVPVMASALRPASFRLCGELADGAISWVSPWEYLRDIALPAMREGASAASRDSAVGRPTPPLVAHMPVVLSDDIETVRTAAGPALSRYANLVNYRGMFELAGFHDAAGGDLNALIEAVAVYGSDEQIAARLGEIISDGAGEIIAHQLPVSQEGLPEQTDHFLEIVARANKLAGVAS